MSDWQRVLLAWAMALGQAGAAHAQQVTTVSLPDVQVVDRRGHFLRLREDIIGNGPVVLQFFFAGCSVVCPVQTSLLRVVRKRIAGGRVRFVSISVDPLNDGPAQLATFATRHQLDTGWAVVAPRDRDLEPLLRAFGVRVTNPAEHANGTWLRRPGEGGWQWLPPGTSVKGVEQAIAALAGEG